MRFQHFHKRHMRGVGKVNVSVFLTMESNQKTMRKALVQVLRTIVGAEFKPSDLFDLGRQGPKGVFYFFDVIGRRAVFEFKNHYVPEQGFLLAVNRCKGQAE